MSDRRLNPANSRVAAKELKGSVDASKFVTGEVQSITSCIADLRAAPDGKRDRQMIFGQAFRVLETHNGWSFGQSVESKYVGYIQAFDLGAPTNPTHFVSAKCTHLYPEPDFKSEEICALSFGALVEIIDQGDRFSTLKNGTYVPHKLLTSINELGTDPVSIAERFLGVPYLWGGNSVMGIDCSGLIQMALHMCGQSCPGDADMQEKMVGKLIGDNVEPARGDLYFWLGHVGILKDQHTLIHANVHNMAVVEEPLAEAIDRIKAQGFGEVTSRKRL